MGYPWSWGSLRTDARSGRNYEQHYETSPNPAVVGQRVTIDFAIVGLNPTGIVTVQASTGEECVAPVQTNGTGSCALVFLSAGTKTLTASYPGDASNQQSVSASATVQVENVTTTTITKNTPNPAKVGKAVTVHFSAVPSSTANKTGPTGSVTVNASTGESCTGPLARSGRGDCTLTFGSAGSRKLVATYSGDANNEGSVSASVRETVN